MVQPIPSSPTPPSHTGTPTTDCVFFDPPPPEIGRVTSAYSSLPVGARMFTPEQRRVIPACAAAVVFGLLLVLGAILRGFGPLCAVPLLGSFAFIVARVYMGTNASVTYVGETGLARRSFEGGPEKLGPREVLLFRDARTLKSSITERHGGGGDVDTRYEFRWAGEHVAFEISHGRAGGGHDLDFARAAEVAWTKWLARQAEAELAARGAIAFEYRLSRISVGPGFVDLCAVGGRRWSGAELVCRVFNGKISLDAPAQRPSHVWSAHWWEVKNAAFFRAVLRTIAGVQVD